MPAISKVDSAPSVASGDGAAAALRRCASLPSSAAQRDGFAGASVHLSRALGRAAAFAAGAPEQPRLFALLDVRGALSVVARHHASLSGTAAMALALARVDEAWRCPITHAPFDKPAVLSCGHMFEAASLRDAMARKPDTCPMCRAPAETVAVQLARAPWYDELWLAIAARDETFATRYLAAVNVPADALTPQGRTLHQALVRADFDKLLLQRCHQDDLDEEETAELLSLAAQTGARRCQMALGARTSAAVVLQAALRSGNVLAVVSALRAVDLTLTDLTTLVDAALERDEPAIFARLTARISGDGPWLLHAAMKKNANACMDALLRTGYRASIEEANALLDTAETEKHVAVALKAGPDLERRDEQERTPLHNAILTERWQAIVALLAAGADATAEDATGFGPYCAAIRAGQYLVASHFFEHNLPMATAGATPLHAILARDILEPSDIEYARMFITELGFRPTEANRNGVTPQQLARERNAVALLELFANHA